jgi:hypothetical protein
LESDRSPRSHLRSAHHLRVWRAKREFLPLRSVARTERSRSFADTASQQLTISGWAIGDTSTPDGLGEISYFFDGVLLGSPDLSSGNYTQSTFQITAMGSDTFSIQFANDDSSNGLDNFSVSAAAGAVPEPSTWVLSLLGFVGLGLLARTSRRLDRDQLEKSVVGLIPD